MTDISLDDFVDDAPWGVAEPSAAVGGLDLIEGVTVTGLVRHADNRGHLTVLLSTLANPIEPVVHVYEVFAEAGSIRAWVFHERQHDRLAFTSGELRVVLFDLRPASGTYRKLNVLDVGGNNPVLLNIPPFVVHGIQNRGEQAATFINMPTRAYDPACPDKSRVPADHPGIPYRFNK